MLVRCYLSYSLSYHDVEKLALKRELKVDHSTINRRLAISLPVWAGYATKTLLSPNLKYPAYKQLTAALQASYRLLQLLFF